MPDHLTPLFDDLRRQALPRVQPPGADVVRRTVHRRVTAQAATAAVVVMAAGVTFGLAQRGEGDGTVVPASSASGSAAPMISGWPVPEASGQLWRGLPNKVEIVGDLVPGADHTDVMADSSQDVGMQAEAGRHRLRVGCSGPAPLPVSILLHDMIDQQHSIACADSGVVEEYEFTMTEAGSVRVIVGNGGQFDAYALKLTRI